MDAPSIHGKLLAWYDREKRDLPWRRSKDPYGIWISEIMLQQTRVETVLPYYARFLSNFPTVESLAAAETDTLLNLWAGLGYYSRARNLQAAAQEMVARFGGQVPTALEDLRSLKGIGAYTSAAIASIAFDQPYAAIDGNLERVLSRVLATRRNPKLEGREEILEAGQALVEQGRPGDVNQALMDLSSRVCLPKDPQCLVCPIQDHCEARKLGIQKELPTRKEKTKPVELQAEAWAILHEEALLLARRPAGTWLQGMWDIPWWIDGRDIPPHAPKESAQFARCAEKRTITKHKIQFLVSGFECEARPDPVAMGLPGSEFRWVPLADFHGVNLPRPSERALEKLLAKREKTEG